MHFEFGHEKHVKNTVAVILAIYDHGTSGRRTRDEIGMLHEKRSTISHVDSEWTEGLSVHCAGQLLYGHGNIVRPLNLDAQQIACMGCTG